MNIITVTASTQYNVIIGSNLYSQLGSFASALGTPCKAAIISDSNVFPIYGKAVESSLQATGFKTCNYIFPAGEGSKNGSTYLSILDFLAHNHITRSDCLIALGGGVVGDITGFAAATYLRGIAYIQVPTTLLAMVDSSVGGKTAIDLPSGKNLAGAFYQPQLVLCDISALDTLPGHIFRDGCAEVIKYGILYDRKLFAHLSEYGLDFDRELVVSRCIELKRDVVAMDEFDRGARQMLNLGHTIGHGIEAYSDYAITHGQAVAIGIAIVSKAGVVHGICDSHANLQIRTVIEQFGLPLSTSASAHELYTCALSDKKRTGDIVNMIIPKSIGNCVIQPTPVDKIQSFIKAGL